MPASPPQPMIQVREVPRTPQPPRDPDCIYELGDYRVQVLRTMHQQRLASGLIERMYSSRGYDVQVPAAVEQPSESVTFGAYSGDRFCATLTVRFDSDAGLLADALYRDEIDGFRKRGHRICEFSRFAIDPQFRSKELLASLFQAGCTHGLAAGMDLAVIEVNPRHTAFYKRMLGFGQAGGVRTCPRVNAPAVLLHVDMLYAEGQIRKYAGQPMPSTAVAEAA